MQVRVLVDAVQRLGHRHAHPVLVDMAHVKHLQPKLADRLLLLGVDAADADEVDVVRSERLGLATPAGELGRSLAEQAGDRHAVHIARGAAGRRIDVRMRVQPDHAQQLALMAAMASDGADRSDRQAVVAAHQHRRLPRRQSVCHLVEHGAVPCHHLVQVTRTASCRGPGIGWAGQVAAVDHLQAVGAQHLDQAGDAKSIRAHARTPHAGADVSGRTNQADGFQAGWLHGFSTPIG